MRGKRIGVANTSHVLIYGKLCKILLFESRKWAVNIITEKSQTKEGGEGVEGMEFPGVSKK